MPEEVKSEVIQRTQKYLGKYVKKPPLTEKLLKKPPFRFLHDIVNTVIRETGFLKGLFSLEELNSENVKDRDSKIAFLTKLIDAVKAITSTDLVVRPSKIVAGLEPTETNVLLQTIGKAIDKKLSSIEYVNQLNSGQVNDKPKPIKRTTEKEEKVKKSKSNEEKPKIVLKPKEKQVSPKNETPKSTDRIKTKRSTTKHPENNVKTKENKPIKTKTREEKSKEVRRSPEKENIIQPSTEIEAITEVPPVENIITAIPSENTEIITPIVENNGQPEEPEVIKRIPSAARPKSARPRSGDFKEVAKEVEPNEVISQARPKTSLRPPSVRPSSARPGAPRLRPDSALPVKELVPMGKINVIVENVDKDADDEETVVIQNNLENVEQNDNTLMDVPGDNKGHLVEQILEQINGDGDVIKGLKVEIDWQKEDLHGNSTSKEIGNLRVMIQNLTKTANPLGKLLNYLHEDIDAMHTELESWTTTKKQLFSEIAKQKKISNEMDKPLFDQLNILKKDIKKIEEEIITSRSNILRNEVQIKDLITK